MTGLYLFINLTVSGTSIFSIKTAALLWFLIGFLRQQEEEEVAGTSGELAVTRLGLAQGRF
jgi:hypothetical protein